MAVRTAYHEALEATRLDVVRLGALVGDAIRVAVDALDNRDASAGARVVAGDDVVDDLRRRIEATLHRADLATAARRRRTARDRGDARDRDRPRTDRRLRRRYFEERDQALRPADASAKSRDRSNCQRRSRHAARRNARLYRTRRRSGERGYRSRRRGRQTLQTEHQAAASPRCAPIPRSSAPERAISSCSHRSNASATAPATSPGTRRT